MDNQGIDLHGRINSFIMSTSDLLTNLDYIYRVTKGMSS